MSFNSGGAVQWGNDITCTIARTGDLMSKSWLKIVLPALNKPLNQVQYWEHKRGVVKGAGNVLTRFESDKMYNLERDPDTGLACNDGEFKGARFCDEIGHAMIDYVEISIGGTVIDKLTGHYLSVWHNLVTSADRQVLDHLIGKSGSIEELEHWAKRPQTLYVPLRFWFSNHIMCSLPLISLQYHEVKIKVKLLPLDLVVPVKGFPAMKGLPEEGSTDNYKPVTGISNGGEPIAKSSQNVPVKISLITNLVYLEEEERRQFNADCKNGRRVREVVGVLADELRVAHRRADDVDERGVETRGARPVRRRRGERRAGVLEFLCVTLRFPAVREHVTTPSSRLKAPNFRRRACTGAWASR